MAQSEPDPAGDKVELGEEGEAPEEDPYDFSGSGDENPGDLNSAFTSQEGEATAAVDKKKKEAVTGYPTRAIERPINLPGGTSEISLTLPTFVDPFAAGASLRGSYGITSEVQVGLRYSMGALSENGFEVGKAVSLDAQYLFTDNIAGQLSLPMFMDPFAMGLVLGAPMKFTFFDTFSLVFGQDLVSIKLHEFVPSLDNAVQNSGFIFLRESNTTTPLWIGNASVRAIYQMGDKLALDAQFGIQFDDSNAASTAQINAGLLHVHSENLDFGARVGALDMSAFVESFSVNLFTNFRI